MAIEWNPKWGQAIANLESRADGGYKAIGPVTRTGDRAYGKYQVMGDNLPKWTKKYYGKVLSPQEFINNPEAQEAVFRGEFGSYVQKYGNADDAASMWFTGRPLKTGYKRKDTLGTTGSKYVSNFNKELGLMTKDENKVIDLNAPMRVGGGQVRNFNKVGAPLGSQAIDNLEAGRLRPVRGSGSIADLFAAQKPKTLLERFGIQKMEEGAEGEAGQRFFNRDTFLNFLGGIGAVAASTPQARARAQATVDGRKAAAQRNETAKYLAEIGEDDLARAVLKGSITGSEAMTQVFKERDREYNEQREDEIYQRDRRDQLADARALANAKQPGMKQDVNGVWRYTDGPDRGKRVFEGVEPQMQYRVANETEIAQFRKMAGIPDDAPLGGALYIDTKTGKPQLIKTSKNDTNVSINMNDSDSELIKQQAKDGYRPKRTADGNFVRDSNGQLEFELIPESEAAKDVEQEELANSKSKFAAATQAQIDSDIITKSVSEVTDIMEDKLGKGFLKRLVTLDLPEAGVFSQYFAGFDQEVKSIQNALKPIKATVAFGRLQRMRDASKTGGALGNVSNVELELLANALGNIEQTSDPKVFVKNLKDIERIYTKVLNDPIAFSVMNASSQEEFERLLTEQLEASKAQEAAGAANFSVGGQNYKITPKR